MNGYFPVDMFPSRTMLYRLAKLLAVPATSKRTTLIFAKATFSQAAQYIIKAGGLDFAPGLTSSYAYRIGRWQIY